MERIISLANKYKYSSMKYIDAEDIAQAVIFQDNDENLLLYQKADVTKELYWTSKSAHNTHLHWASNSKESFIDGLKEVMQHIRQNETKAEKLYIEFIPEEFLEEMTEVGLAVVSEWVDYWNRDLQALNIDASSNLNIRALRRDETSIASEITKRCSSCSRGFTGQSEKVLREWLETENSYLFAAELDGNLAGLCYVLLYGFDSEKGTVLWIRELVVDPIYQSKGIGRQLMSHGINWGKKKGAKRSFLACDAENHNAIKLYESLQYDRKKERGQINMEALL